MNLKALFVYVCLKDIPFVFTIPPVFLLSHQLYYYVDLVEWALRVSRNLVMLPKNKHSHVYKLTRWLYTVTRVFLHCFPYKVLHQPYKQPSVADFVEWLIGVVWFTYTYIHTKSITIITFKYMNTMTHHRWFM